MPSKQQWRQIYTLSYSAKGPRSAVIIPIPLVAEWVRIEVIILTIPKPKWYLAGWLNQAYDINSKPYLMPSVEVPLAPSVFRMPADTYYKIRFKPVVYLPPAIVKVYRSM